jgi:hypothetical protein
VIYNHYLQHTGTYVPCECALNFSELGWEHKDLHHLEISFSEAEVKGVILSMPREKAPRPNRFIGAFFSSCWEVIKLDIMRDVFHFYLMNQQGLQFLNQAYVVLIPKKADPHTVFYFKPISLTHSFVRIISKILINRLAPELNDLISENQAAFI